MKMTFKHGDRVTCEIQGEKIEDARISIDRNEDVYICQNIKDGAYADDMLGYEYSWFIGNKEGLFLEEESITNLKLKQNNMKTLRDLEVGDIVIDDDGDDRKVIERFTQSVLLSCYSGFRMAGTILTFEELEDNGFKVKQEEPEEETVEIAGRKYNKSEFEKATKDLKEVK